MRLVRTDFGDVRVHDTVEALGITDDDVARIAQTCFEHGQRGVIDLRDVAHFTREPDADNYTAVYAEFSACIPIAIPLKEKP